MTPHYETKCPYCGKFAINSTVLLENTPTTIACYPVRKVQIEATCRDCHKGVLVTLDFNTSAKITKMPEDSE